MKDLSKYIGYLVIDVSDEMLAEANLEEDEIVLLNNRKYRIDFIEIRTYYNKLHLVPIEPVPTES